MANDRMFLLHNETKLYIILAKHMGGELYTSNVTNIEVMNEFFDHVYLVSGEHDGFSVVMENDVIEGIKSFHDIQQRS